ncbi:MAG: S46 family peptidase [Coprobacter sp.]|nr:S46 family peptidase [Coprobacter sp.]
MKLKTTFTSLLLATAVVAPVKADEGMWLLPFLKQQNSEQLKKAGLMMDIDDIYNPDATSMKDAIIIFGNGCTGEIISSEGLILTNHHCGYGAIQQHSTVEHDYLTDGFWAMDKSQELHTPGLQVRFIDKIEEVTDIINKAVEESGDEMKAFNTAFLSNKARELAGEEFLAQNPFVEVVIKPFYGGNRFFMFYMTVYNDIRMVGAPPSSIGKFGADTDNWMWPRHTGDFSLFRVYTSPDGKPAEYSADNVPLKPKRYFKISLGGVQENDYAMIMGFPGTTNRYYTSWEVKEMRDIENATRIEMRGVRQAEMLDEMLADPAVRIQYASKYARSSNYHKNSIGMNRGIDKLDVIGTKERQEEALRQWSATNNHPEYIEALDEIKTVMEALAPINLAYCQLNEGIRMAIECSQVPATGALKKALQDKNYAKVDTLIDVLRGKYAQFANKDYSRKVDQRVTKAMLKAYKAAVAEGERFAIYDLIDKKFKGNIDRYVDEAFKTSIFASDENFEKFCKKPTVKALEKDLLVALRNAFVDKYQEIRAEARPLDERLTKAKKVYIKGLLDMAGDTPTYPDANFTIRLTYGNVLPYSPADGVEYSYFTTQRGILEKEDPDNWEFVVPARLKELILAKDFGEYALPNGDLPTCFLSNNDITGGNSGSPVINAYGELIGAAFDGNWEAMSGDIVFEKELQRCINVDIRYILFIIDKYAGAKNLIEEMDIVREYRPNIKHTDIFDEKAFREEMEKMMKEFYNEENLKK